MRRVGKRIRPSTVALVAGTCLSACVGDPSGPDVRLDGIRQEPLPAPLFDIPVSADDHLEVAVLAGGCFWTVEAVFEHVQGVHDVVPGYAGGTAETANYERVARYGDTEHAEVVEITYDPTVVSYGRLLQIFFSAAHDPTQVDRQEPDVGSEYRSQIYYRYDAERAIAEAYIQQIDAAGLLSKPIATRVDPLVQFFPAEPEHQDFAARHPDDPYVLIYGIPKILRLAALFPNLYRD